MTWVPFQGEVCEKNGVELFLTIMSDIFSKKNILITGANGYIGSSVAKTLANKARHLTLFTRQTGDIADKNIWKSLLKNIDIIFHFAAQTSSRFANNNPHQDLETNVLPILSMIETCIKYNYSPDIVFSGAVTEVGYTEKGKTNEEQKDLPITIYDIHKLTAEKYLQYYSNQLKRRAAILRLPNIYGPGPSSSRPDRGITNMMVKKAIKGEPLTVYGDGSYVRDYLYIDDVVDAFLKAAANLEKTKGKYYVVGTGVGHTILEMATIIKEEAEKITDKKIKILFASFPEGTSPIEYRNFIADSSKFRKDTGWSAKISLREGIRKTIEYFKNSRSEKIGMEAG